MGFADTARAAKLLAELGLGGLGLADGPLLDALAGAADPDQALAALVRMAPDAELMAALHADPVLRDRLASVLGASAALGDHLARHRADWRLLAAGATFPAFWGDLRSDLLTVAGGPDAATRLRIAYRRRLLQLAARDLTGADSLEEIMGLLADLTTAALDAALA